MQVFEYVIQKGDTLGLIAKKFTGNKERWIEMIESNPTIPRVRNEFGQKTFVPQRFQVGQRIFLPYGWIAGKGVVMGVDGIVSGAASGTVGGTASGTVGVFEKCSVSAVEYHPTARYKVQGSEYPYQVAQKFDRPANAFHQLMGANAESPAGFIVNENDQCVMANWLDLQKTGGLIRFPKEWLDVAPEFFPKDVLPYLKNVDGTPWVPPTGGGKTPGVPGTQGSCAAGEVLAGDGVTCIPKGTGTGVGAKDEGMKASSWVWIGLAAAAGIGGALLLNNLIKAKRVRGAPPGYPALPPAQVKEEVVVRR